MGGPGRGRPHDETEKRHPARRMRDIATNARGAPPGFRDAHARHERDGPDCGAARGGFDRARYRSGADAPEVSNANLPAASLAADRSALLGAQLSFPRRGSPADSPIYFFFNFNVERISLKRQADNSPQAAKPAPAADCGPRATR